MAKRSQSRRQRRSVKGGSSDAYAAYVYGANQTAAAGSNVIQMRDPSGFVPTAIIGGSAVAVVPPPSVEISGYVPASVQALTPVSGGSRQKRGGTILNDIAIPALFIAANNMVGSRRSKGKSRGRRSRRVKFSRKRR